MMFKLSYILLTSILAKTNFKIMWENNLIGYERETNEVITKKKQELHTHTCRCPFDPGIPSCKRNRIWGSP